MKSPLTFAVAIPIGSWHPFLPEAFASLAAQPFSLNIALLDASADPRVAQAADASGLTFAYRRHGPDQGQSDAIREGWSNTEGEVLFWLNADDRLTQNALEIVAKAFDENPNLHAVYGLSEFINEEGQTTGDHDQVAPISDMIFRSNIISQPSCFVKRHAINSVGGVNPSLHYVMDWDLWVRLYAAGMHFHFIPETLSRVYMGSDTKTDEIQIRRLKEVFNLVRRNRNTYEAFKSTLALIFHTLSFRAGRK